MFAERRRSDRRRRQAGRHRRRGGAPVTGGVISGRAENDAAAEEATGTKPRERKRGCWCRRTMDGRRQDAGAGAQWVAGTAGREGAGAGAQWVAGGVQHDTKTRHLAAVLASPHRLAIFAHLCCASNRGGVGAIGLLV